MGGIVCGDGCFRKWRFCCLVYLCLLGVVLYIYFARSGEVLSLECPRESTQREGHPGALIGCRRFLAFLAKPGVRTTRDLALLDTLRQGAHLDPGLAAVLSECKREQVGRFWGLGLSFPHPSGAAEHRSKGRKDARACLSAASCASAGLYEKRRGHPRSGQASGIAFLLDTFLWRSKEKYLARMGETKSRKM